MYELFGRLVKCLRRRFEFRGMALKVVTNIFETVNVDMYLQLFKFSVHAMMSYWSLELSSSLLVGAT